MSSTTDRPRLLLLLALLVCLSACTTETEDLAITSDTETIDTLSITEENNTTEESTQNGTAGSDDGTPGLPPVITSDILPGLQVTDYVVVSTRRTGRTSMEYTLKIKISNSDSSTYENVLATLLSTPAHITVIDAAVNVGNIPGNSTILSLGTFTIDADLALGTSFNDLVWRIEGDVSTTPPPPPRGKPTASGFFMSIDNNAIKGESTVASHKDWIELTTIMEGLHLTGIGTGISQRRRSSFEFDDLVVMKRVDRSSPDLRRALTEGTFFGEVKIDIIKKCGNTFYTAYAITLTTAQMEDVSIAGDGDNLNEEAALVYGRIENMYTPVAADCSLLTPVFSTQDGKLLQL